MALLRYYVYVLTTIWAVFALIFVAFGMAFGWLGPEVMAPVFVVVTAAGVWSVARQRW